MATLYRCFLISEVQTLYQEHIAGGKDGYVVSLFSYSSSTDFVPKSI